MHRCSLTMTWIKKKEKFKSKKKPLKLLYLGLGMMICTFIPSSLEAEARGYLVS